MNRRYSLLSFVLLGPKVTHHLQFPLWGLIKRNIKKILPEIMLFQFEKHRIRLSVISVLCCEVFRRRLSKTLQHAIEGPGRSAFELQTGVSLVSDTVTPLPARLAPHTFRQAVLRYQFVEVRSLNPSTKKQI